ncbi:hypothetical protein [Leeuwenhoekiella sp. LLG6367-2.1]|uniref:hypothetical protein n=1 Tax=Leeuwenhoekiella sp. LLG6367-2.1 TaxID=3160833 RepID=UPI00386D4D75
MIYLMNDTTKYGINTEWNNLTLQERKDMFTLLIFLNHYEDVKEAFKHIKTRWVNLIQPISGEYGTPEYSNSTSGRYNTFKRLKTLYSKYIVQVN